MSIFVKMYCMTIVLSKNNDVSNLQFRVGKTGPLGPWSRVMVICNKLSQCKRTADYDTLYFCSKAPKSCFANPSLHTMQITKRTFELDRFRTYFLCCKSEDQHNSRVLLLCQLCQYVNFEIDLCPLHNKNYLGL